MVLSSIDFHHSSIAWQEWYRCQDCANSILFLIFNLLPLGKDHGGLKADIVSCQVNDDMYNFFGSNMK